MNEYFVIRMGTPNDDDNGISINISSVNHDAAIAHANNYNRCTGVEGRYFVINRSELSLYGLTYEG